MKERQRRRARKKVRKKEKITLNQATVLFNRLICRSERAEVDEIPTFAMGSDGNAIIKKENDNLHIWRAEWEKDKDSLVRRSRPLG